MNTRFFGPMILSACVALTACSHKKDEKKKKTPAQETASLSYDVTQERVDKVTDTWPESSQKAIDILTQKYGLPDAVTSEMVVWNDTAPFKRSVVFKEEVNHMFPVQHSDVLQQTVNYRVPLDKVYLLSKFDGSLLVDRTKGELSSRNEREEMNILAFNLADKIIRGEMTVEGARRQYQKKAEALEAGSTDKMLTSLSFQTRSNTSDPDTMMQSQEARQDQKKQRQVDEVDVIIIDQSQPASKGTKRSGSRIRQEEQKMQEPTETESDLNNLFESSEENE